MSHPCSSKKIIFSRRLSSSLELLVYIKRVHFYLNIAKMSNGETVFRFETLVNKGKEFFLKLSIITYVRRYIVG